ncbi:MAG: hypothetical protein K2J74_02655, partial [Muribaculaceae bacterium]|nr:hypothetical protein [Muribaculaceae bacterium]
MRYIKWLLVIAVQVLMVFNHVNAAENLEEETKHILSMRNLSAQERVDSAFNNLIHANDLSRDYQKINEGITADLIIPYAEKHKVDSATCSDLYSNLAHVSYKHLTLPT